MSEKISKEQFVRSMNEILPASMSASSRKNYKLIPEDVDLSETIDKFGLDSLDFFSAGIYMEDIFGLDQKETKEFMENYDGPLDLNFLKEIVERFAVLPLPTIEDIKKML